MRAVVQRVTEAEVTVQGSSTGSIQNGLVVLLGVEDGDTKKDADYIADKVSGLRIFDDSEGVMNLSVSDIGGGILSISQFTLLADARKGKRPRLWSRRAPAANLWLNTQRLLRQVSSCWFPLSLYSETAVRPTSVI